VPYRNQEYQENGGRERLCRKEEKTEGAMPFSYREVNNCPRLTGKEDVQSGFKREKEWGIAPLSYGRKNQTMTPNDRM